MNKRNLDPQFLATLTVLDSAEAAAYLRTSTSTLAKYRMYGGGPIHIKQSTRKTLYRKADLDAWLSSREAA
ncbi:helix-turn-helix transcriptional regulator [Brucella grignonensis]|uniref:Helix-turn-helix domain protein n=1 Tax=Brucella grignonensis TaxID=94627 RepID=A0A256FEK3_9HYPH|nr:helix-turn-helix domain-containing protein [Brucella grignonensis]NKB83343.1 helix-turn-helix domain-containing protein [Brucella grignonensis]NKB84409.1 helix-turn-helix domain-containing protein [Brucella grignonensis]OYR13307.1 helix-turn-helix domain protein [Brucella grignonensis]